MKKQLSIIFILLIVVLAGAAFYQQYRIRTLRTAMKEQTDSIASVYMELAEENALSLRREYALTQQQEQIAVRVEDARNQLLSADKLEDRLAGIGALQRSLVQFASGVSADERMAADERFIFLTTQMGESSTIRPLLQTYNDLALQWNTAIQSDLATVGRQSGTHNKILPSLHFNGEEQFISIIEL